MVLLIPIFLFALSVALISFFLDRREIGELHTLSMDCDHHSEIEYEYDPFNPNSIAYDW